MKELDVRYANHPEDSKHYTTEELRKHYLIENVFVEDDIALTYSHQDRIIAGGAYPVNKVLKLEAGDALRADYFLQRRELGIINIAGDGVVTLDGVEYELTKTDCLYVGMGTKEVLFSSKSLYPAFFADFKTAKNDELFSLITSVTSPIFIFLTTSKNCGDVFCKSDALSSSIVISLYSGSQ